MGVNEDLKTLKELSDERSNKFYYWLRWVVLGATGMISVLTALHPNKSETKIEHYFYSITMSLIALGILTGTIVLFSEIHIAEKKRKSYSDRLQERNVEQADYGEVIYLDTPKIYKFLEIVCYASFSASLLSLVLYAVIKDA